MGLNLLKVQGKHDIMVMTKLAVAERFLRLCIRLPSTRMWLFTTLYPSAVCRLASERRFRLLIVRAYVSVPTHRVRMRWL